MIFVDPGISVTLGGVESAAWVVFLKRRIYCSHHDCWLGCHIIAMAKILDM